VMSDGYWLAHWLDEHDIRNQRSAQRFLGNPKHVEDLLATASATHSTLEPLNGADGTTIVAGKTIDLSGRLGCFHPECLQKDVDRLLSRAWHYFDIIVVEGLAPERVSALHRNDPDRFVEIILGFIENYLYVRNIGAEDMLMYRQKSHACIENLQHHAEKYAATDILKERTAWVQAFSIEAQLVRLNQHDDHWHYIVTHPTIEHFASGVVHQAGTENQRPSESDIYANIFDLYAANLISDIGTARYMLSPLGSAAMIHEKLLSGSSVETLNAQGALFNLELPFVSGLKAKDLIKIRRENGQYFDAFRLALRTAAQEYVTSAADGTSPSMISSQIQGDLIEPELIRIRRELRISADILSRKSLISLPIGSLATAVGLLGKTPLVAVGAAAVIAAAGISNLVIDYKKYVDDKRNVLMSDMYFLWNAERIADRKKH
jgi:hypothetical protein